jgi:hypothetical protein
MVSAKPRPRRTIVALLLGLTASLHAAGGPATQQSHDWTTFNVCQLVPGDAVARAVGARLNQAMPVYDKSFSRCIYRVTSTATNKPNGYVVWVDDEAMFEELKTVADVPLVPVAGLGDGAYIFQDKGDGRFKLRVLKRGDLMIEVTGDTAESARKVADVVVTYLWKKKGVS